MQNQSDELSLSSAVLSTLTAESEQNIIYFVYILVFANEVDFLENEGSVEIGGFVTTK
jgi:hypothetical protein